MGYDLSAEPRTEDSPDRTEGRPVRSRVHRGLREIAIVAGLWIVYSVSRHFADDDRSVAVGHARELLRLEKNLHIDVERSINHALGSTSWLAVAASYWYALLYYTVTIAVLVYLFRRHRGGYARARNALVVATAIALVGYLLYPTAPPRLTPGGYLDTLAHTAHYGWWSAHASAPSGMGSLTNEFAAMPSMHVGWSLWAVWALWRYVGRTARVLWSLYVAGMTWVVIATANHWILDCLAGLVVMGVGILIAESVTRASARDRPALGPPA